MKKREEWLMRVIKTLFTVIACGICIFFLVGEIIYPSEQDRRDSRCKVFESQWYQVKDDGSRQLMQVPGEVQPDSEGKIRVETMLPSYIEADDWIAFRTAKQDVKVYVGDELRKEYSTKYTRPFGKDSVSQYIFVNLNSEDAGKSLTYQAQSSDMNYAGIVRQAYYGDKFAIWLHIFMESGLETIVTLFILVIALVSVSVIAVLNIKYRRNIKIQYLCWGIFLLALWMIAQSDIRQLLFPNISLANSMTYFSIMIMPIPFMVYVDSLQNHRYIRAYMVACVAALIDFAVCTFLQLAGYRDFSDLVKFIFGTIFVALGLIMATFIIDFKKGLIKEYRLVVFGFFGAIVSALIEMMMYFDTSKVLRTTTFSYGILFLLIMAGFKAMQDVLRIDYEKRKAIMASESKARFLASMSHEIRTPINAVLGMDEMILRESSESSIREYAMDIRSAGKSLLALINDILDFSKIESGKMELNYGDYKTAFVVNDCYNMIAMRAREKNLEFELEIDPDTPERLRGDEFRIRQIVINLLTNAVKYTNQGKIIFRLGYQPVENKRILLDISVEDTGIGIAKENLAKLFDTFQRIDLNKNRNVEGTGLGLCIVKQLVELMNGTIKVESEYGKGSKFSVSIPQAVVSDRVIGEFSPEYVNNTEEQLYKESFTAEGTSILVVDDVPMNLKVFKALLKNTGINIDTAESGKECLGLVRQKKYNIIFMDHMMPVMDGIQTLHKMNEMPDNKNSDTPVIMLTANAITGAKENYLNEGFADYLSKPIREAKLEEMVLQFLPKEMIKFIDDMVEENGGNVMEALDFLDVKQALEYCAGDEEFYIEVIKEYIASQKTAEIQQSYDAQDWDNYRILVHALKSTSLTIGAVEVNQLALAVEKAVKEGNYDYALEHHDELMAKYRELLDKLKNAVG